MKTLFKIVLISFMASQSFGAIVKSARLDESKENILIDVVYSGGCEDHDFSLKVGSCLESFPVQCSAELVDNTTTDICEAIVSETIALSLEKSGLSDSYYKKASLTITGDKDWGTNTPSQVNVQLP